MKNLETYSNWDICEDDDGTITIFHKERGTPVFPPCLLNVIEAKAWIDDYNRNNSVVIDGQHI